MEISDMIEKAKMLSTAMGNSAESVNEEQMEQFAKMANIIKFMNESSQNNQSTEEEKENTAPKRLFDEIENPAIRAIKSAIPYLDFEYQKNLGVMIKIIELDNLIKKYKDTTLQTASVKEKGWQKEMLLAMKPELDEKKQYFIDMFLKIIDMKEIMDLMKTANGRVEK